MTSITTSYPAFLPAPVAARSTAAATPTEAGPAEAPGAATDPTGAAAANAQAADKTANPARSTGELDPAELAKLRELQAIDRKVHAHEAAHAAVAGHLGSGKSFSYVTGPDGVRYAVGGEVGISFGGSSNPATTLENAERVRAAALAPVDPSPQDLRVAARAQQLILQAQQDLNRQQAEASSTTADTTSSDPPSIKAFRSVADAATTRTPQLDLRA